MPIDGISSLVALSSHSSDVSIAGSASRAAREIQRASRRIYGGAEAAHDHAVNRGMHHPTAASVADNLPAAARNAACYDLLRLAGQPSLDGGKPRQQLRLAALQTCQRDQRPYCCGERQRRDEHYAEKRHEP